MAVKPLHALLIVLLFGGLVVMASWSSMQATQIGGPTDLRIDSRDRLHVRIHDRVLVYSQSRMLVDEYSLGQFGIGDIWGSYAFFNDHSLLLSPASLQDDDTALSKPIAQADLGKLMRCTPATGNCSVLEQFGRRFKQTYRADIDENGDIFLADTGTGEVFWLSGGGEVRAMLAANLDRPNQLRRYADTLAIANTEAEELLLIPLLDGRFAAADQWTHLSTAGSENRSHKHTRPLDFTRLGTHWWVLAKTADMRSGALYRYTPEGNYLADFELPPGADPFALTVFGGELLVADYALMRVYRYSSDGEYLGDLVSVEQTDFVAGLVKRKNNYTVLQYAAWGVFSLALVVGLIVGIARELKKSASSNASEDEDIAPRVTTARPHPMDPRIHWLHARKAPLRTGMLAFFAMLLMPLVLALDLPGEGGDSAECTRLTMEIVIWGGCGLLAAITLPLGLHMRNITRTRIGVADEWVLVDHGNGVVRIARDEELLRVNNGFIIDQTTVPTGTPQVSLYDKAEVEQWLKPRMQRATHLGPLAQTKWQWQHKRSLFIALAIGIALMVVLLVMVEAGWAEQWFTRWIESQPACQEKPVVPELQ